MDRLTNGIEYCKLHCDFKKLNECFFSNKDKCYERNMYNKLKDYEDAEEQGLLLRLPCKIGDTVYLIKPNSDRKIIPRTADMMFLGVLWEDYRKEWFLTKVEAEQKLKEMKDK